MELRRKYTTEEKQEMVELTEHYTLKSIADKYGVNPKTLSNWKKKFKDDKKY